MIPYGRQSISEEDIQAVVEVLKSDFLTQGPTVPLFETKIRELVGAKYAVAVNSATSALHIACLALGVKEGDIVWTSPISFVATANCAVYCGAEVDFVDISLETYNMDISALEEKLTKAATNGRLPKVVIPVHLAGQSCDMEAIHKLSIRFGFKIIEDASHAIGGKYKNEHVGNCKYSDIVVFSFHPVKIITTGEGGVATTNNPDLFNIMYRLRSHGITRDTKEMTHPPDGPWYYQQLELGFNYRMTDIQAALGISQLTRLESFISERHVIAKKYDQKLNPEFFVKPVQIKDAYSSLHLYIIRFRLDKIKYTQKQIFEQLRLAGILVNLHYIPIYKHPFYRKYNYKIEFFPNSERYYKEAMSLPIFPGLSESQLDEVVYRLTHPVGYQTLF
jgi:UDP-4-amino-4,6-dideoxy-N-acetyl-beta-L-altrosamine transaminase